MLPIPLVIPAVTMMFSLLVYIFLQVKLKRMAYTATLFRLEAFSTMLLLLIITTALVTVHGFLQGSFPVL